MPPDEIGAFQFLVDAAKSEISNQADAFNQLDSKVGVILGFSVVAIVQLFGFSIRSGNPFVELPLLVGLLVIAAAISLLVATCFGVAARWPSAFDDGWSVTKLVDSDCQSLEELQQLGLMSLRQAIKDNDTVIERKARLTKSTHLFAILSLIFFCVALLVMAIDGVWAPIH